MGAGNATVVLSVSYVVLVCLVTRIHGSSIKISGKKYPIFDPYLVYSSPLLSLELHGTSLCRLELHGIKGNILSAIGGRTSRNQRTSIFKLRNMLPTL